MSSWFEHGTRNGTRAMLLQLDDVLEILDTAELDVLDTEFLVWHPLAGGIMGRADARVLDRRTGQIGILDWKTQARFWTWQEIAGQLYGYDSAPFIWVGPEGPEGAWALRNDFGEEYDLRGQSEECKFLRVALVMHMPLEGKPELHEVDLEYGQQVLETAAENIRLRSIGRSMAVGRRPSGIRPR
jgi:hypothetical protein